MTFPSELVKVWPISKRANSPQNDDEGLLQGGNLRPEATDWPAATIRFR